MDKLVQLVLLVALVAGHLGFGYSVYETDQGKIAVDPGNPQGIRIYSMPAMGLNGTNFVPLMTDVTGALIVSSGGGGITANVNLHDALGNGITSTLIGPKNGIDSNIINTVTVAGNLGRTWTLSSGTDSVSASVSNFPATQDVNLTQVGGISPSATNWVPSRVTNGTTYVDPTQIRALTTSDQVTAFQGGAPWSVSQSGAWTTGRTWTLSSGTDSVAVIGTVTANQGTNPWVANISQFGGSNVVTGTGASGSGIPRVTVSNDSNILATQSGTWTVQPGNTANTTPWLTTDTSDGPVTPGTVATKSGLAGGQFNSSDPSLTNTQQAALQLDASGKLKTTSSTALTTQPTATANATPVSRSADAYGLGMVIPMEASLALWGKMFNAATGFQNTASSTEAPILYVNNPNGSGVNMKIRAVRFTGSAAASDLIQYALYKAPTITSNGTTLTPVGNRQSGQATAQVQLFTLPTASAFGTKVDQYQQETQAGTLTVNYNFDLWLEPNNKYLFTVTQAGTGGTKATSISLEYAEQ